MTTRSQSGFLRLTQRLIDEGVLASRCDADLVERFATTRDPEAFAVIVARHGPMVAAVCRGILGPCGDVDDAFQATFLVLLNSAGTFSAGLSLGGWLRRVAQRVARQSRLADMRRRRRERAAALSAESAMPTTPERFEIIQMIREEVDRLPEHYRATIVLCDLQGLTRDEAAQLLGCPPGTVGGRLARARRRLRDRMESRGVTWSMAFPVLSDVAPAALAWRTSVEAAVRSTAALATGRSTTPGASARGALRADGGQSLGKIGFCRGIDRDRHGGPRLARAQGAR